MGHHRNVRNRSGWPKSVCVRQGWPLVKALGFESRWCFSRDVAQFGSAPVLGTGCRKFESSRPDKR